jgi:hypothetical protein
MLPGGAQSPVPRAFHSRATVPLGYAYRPPPATRIVAVPAERFERWGLMSRIGVLSSMSIPRTRRTGPSRYPAMPKYGCHLDGKRPNRGSAWPRAVTPIQLSPRCNRLGLVGSRKLPITLNAFPKPPLAPAGRGTVHSLLLVAADDDLDDSALWPT